VYLEMTMTLQDTQRFCWLFRSNKEIHSQELKLRYSS